MTRIATTTISGTIAADDDNDNSIAYAYFIKVSFVVKVCEKLHIKIDWNVLLPILSAVEMPIIIMCMPLFSLPFSLSVLSHIFPVIRFLLGWHSFFVQFIQCAMPFSFMYVMSTARQPLSWHIKFLMLLSVNGAHGQYPENILLLWLICRWQHWRW